MLMFTAKNPEATESERLALFANDPPEVRLEALRELRKEPNTRALAALVTALLGFGGLAAVFRFFLS